MLVAQGPYMSFSLGLEKEKPQAFNIAVAELSIVVSELAAWEAKARTDSIYVLDFLKTKLLICYLVNVILLGF